MNPTDRLNILFATREVAAEALDAAQAERIAATARLARAYAALDQARRMSDAADRRYRDAFLRDAAI